MNTEDREWVSALANSLKGLLEWSITMSERRANLEMAALQMVLLRRELVTPEELDAAKQELQAGMAVNEALDPEIQAFLKDVNEQLRKLDEPPEK